MSSERRDTDSVLQMTTVLICFLAAALVGGCTSAVGTSSGHDPYGGTVIEKQGRFEGMQGTYCPSGTPVDQQIDVDGSNSSDGLANERLPIVIDSARITAICGGRLRVVVFSRSISDTDAVIDEQLDPGDGTYASQVLKADKSIEEMVGPISRALSDPPVDPKGTDILSVLQDAAETRSQLADGNAFRLLLITDGENTVDTRVTTRTTAAKATTIGTSVPVPNLTDADVVITGVGIFGRGRQPSTAYTAALKAFLQTVCDRATGSTCPPPTTHFTMN
jgi:hypothetical protein